MNILTIIGEEAQKHDIMQWRRVWLLAMYRFLFWACNLLTPSTQRTWGDILSHTPTDQNRMPTWYLNLRILRMNVRWKMPIESWALFQEYDACALVERRIHRGVHSRIPRSVHVIPPTPNHLSLLTHINIPTPPRAPLTS